VTTTATTADELLTVVNGMRRVLRRRLRADLQWPRLPPAQVELLVLVDAEPAIGIAAAARSLHLAGNTVSTLVNQLVDAGLVLRETDPADRRAARLVLTEAGRARLARWRRARRRLVGEAMDRLPADEVTALGGALPALRHLLDELAEEEGP
jgi:DNA-binding MarR family transcriptional regulator